MEALLRPSHKRSSSLSAPYTPAPRPSFAPFDASPEVSLDLPPAFPQVERQRRSLELPRIAILAEELRVPKRYSGGEAGKTQENDLLAKIVIAADQTFSQDGESGRPYDSPHWVQSPSNLSFDPAAATPPAQDAWTQERRLWKTLLTQVLAVAVPLSRERDAEVICAELESDLQLGPVEDALQRAHSRILRLFDPRGHPEDAEEWRRRCQFYSELLEQQSAQLAAMRLEHTPVETRTEVVQQVTAVQAELRKVRELQRANEAEIDLQQRKRDEERRQAEKDKANLHDSVTRLSACVEQLTQEKAALQTQLTALQSSVVTEKQDKQQLAASVEEGSRREAGLRLKVTELEEELRSAVSPYLQLQQVGEQIGKKFTTVSDLFAYLASNLQAGDPDQQLLLKSYQSLSLQLSGPIASSPAPTFISAMLSFLLIRKKMIEEERELQGQTLSSLSSQLTATRCQLEVKSKEWESMADLLQTAKTRGQGLEVELELCRRRMEAAEEELKVIKKAHERHIDLYQTELDTVKKRTSTAEQLALEKGLQVETLSKAVQDLQARVDTCEEENEALGHENSFLTYERSELQRNLLCTKLKGSPMTASLKELSLTLREIHKALKEQSSQERNMEALAYSLQQQLEKKQEQLDRLTNEMGLFAEDVRTRDCQRTDWPSSFGLSRAVLGSVDPSLTAEALLEAKYDRLKGMYRRLERAMKRVMEREKQESVERKVSQLDISQQPLRTPDPCDKSLDRMSAVVRMSRSSLCPSLLSQVQALSPGQEQDDMREMEALLEPYREGDEELPAVLSRLIREYEQFQQSGSGLEADPVAALSGSIIIHSIERPPARLSLYSADGESPADMMLELLPCLPSLYAISRSEEAETRLIRLLGAIGLTPDVYRRL